MKKSIIYSIFIVIIIIIIFVFTNNKKTEVVIIPQPSQSIAMCYQYSKQTSRGFVDRAWLQMNISGDKVTGEYQNLPAETDSKVGKFEGTVGPMDPKISGRIADVWWNSLAEGMNVTEQLKVEFGEGSAVVLFGEMLDRGDGTYIYKDVTNLTSGFQMSQTDCQSLDDKIIVEKYIRDNIRTIAPEKPVLGGSWYATIVEVNPSTKTGTMEYEDGHIQGKASFNYVRNGTQVTVNLIFPKTCYKYHHAATTNEPYAVDEYINMTIDGTKVTGTKNGTQNGPDLTNGYTGTLEGNLDQGLITAIFSYTVEGSSNKEKELYKIVNTGLQKLRYPLIEKTGMLVPDTTKKFTMLSYLIVDCSLIK